LPKVSTTARCPYCKADHSWMPKDARYAEVILPPDWVENQKK
jgi:hypothetical protein